MVKYTTKDGLLMHGILSKSREDNQTVIITIFGMTSSFFSSSWINELIKTAQRTSIDVLSANNRGAGSVFPFKSDEHSRFIGTARERFEDCIYDISAAIDVAEKLKYKRIILAGHSTGCQKATYYMSKTHDKRVNGIILLAPVDDYNSTRNELGNRFNEAVKIAKAMVEHGKGERQTPEWISYYTARRFLSYAEKSNTEAKIFNYESKMEEFASVRCPILAVFGSKEEHAPKNVNQMLSTLEKRTKSRSFKKVLMKGTGHQFIGKRKALAKTMLEWASKIK